MSKNDNSNMDRIKEFTSPNRVLISLILSIFFVELSIMIAFLMLPPLPPVAEMLVDSTC